ncbi:MAG: type II toxin-antitoxin system RelE/ParE family toxin [Spirochaetota bacterium]
MSHSVKWTKKADKDYSQILQYLKEEFGLKVAVNFKTKVEKEINRITKWPKMNPISEFLKIVRRAVIVKQVSLYYVEIEYKKEIIVIRLYDNRKNTENIASDLNKEISNL